MLKDIDVFASIPRTLFQSQAPLSDANAAPGDITTQAVSQVPAISSDEETGYSFAQSIGSLRGLGLRLPGNAGDSEALILLIDLVSGRLSNDNEAQKGISQNMRKRGTLGEMQQRYRDLASIRSALENLTAQRSDLIADKSALQSDLAAQQTREHDLRDLVATLSVDPEANAEQLAHAQRQLDSVVATVGSLESEISNVAGQINRIEGDIAQRQELEADALQFIATMFNFVMALDQTYLNNSEDHHGSHMKANREDQQREIFENVDRIYELDSEDQTIREAVVQNDIDRRNQELAALSAGLSSIIYATMDVIAQEKSAKQLDLHTLAHSTNGGNRLQLAL